MKKRFEDTPIFREMYQLFMQYDTDLTPKYNLTDILKELKKKFGKNPKYAKLNLSTVKRWVDKYELNDARQKIVNSSTEIAVSEKETVEEKLEVIDNAQINDLKEKYKSLDSIFKQSQFLLNRVLQVKIKEFEVFLQEERTTQQISEFLRGLNLSERELSIVNSKAFECLQRLNPDNDVKKAFDNFFVSFNESFGKI